MILEAIICGVIPPFRFEYGTFAKIANSQIKTWIYVTFLLLIFYFSAIQPITNLPKNTKWQYDSI
jgi:hypothetical protein